jgi:hypothetical protein
MRTERSREAMSLPRPGLSDCATVHDTIRKSRFSRDFPLARTRSGAARGTTEGAKSRSGASLGFTIDALRSTIDELGATIDTQISTIDAL